MPLFVVSVEEVSNYIFSTTATILFQEISYEQKFPLSVCFIVVAKLLCTIKEEVLMTVVISATLGRSASSGMVWDVWTW